MLEYIWTRLDRLFGLPTEAWGEDLADDMMNAYLAARPAVTAYGRTGWDFTYAAGDPAIFEDVPRTEPWSPSLLTDSQAMVVLAMCRGSELRFDDEQLIEQLASNGVDDLDEFWSALLATKLVARSADGANLVLLPSQCGLAVLPNGQWVAGENNTGRLERWAERQKSDPGPAPEGPN